MAREVEKPINLAFDPRLKNAAEKILATNSTIKGIDYLLSEEKKKRETVAALILLGILSPAIAIASLANLIEVGPREIIYREQCPHPAMKEDVILYKFRTMRREGNPSTITRTGRVLREYSIDEALQLTQVGRNMLLIAPRPFNAKEWPRVIEPHINLSPFKEYIACLQRGVLYGVTGAFYAVFGRKTLDPIQRVHLDVLYMKNASEVADRRLFCLTSLRVLSRRGAY